ncbi:MAG: DUF58 domain-containing protein [Desulfobacteraceae bacterium]|jgi:uncharacterized protein (DUF58 family)
MKILPTNRLLLATALIFFPGTIVAAFFPEGRTVVYAVLAGFSALVILDALWSLSVLSGVSVDIPDVTRLTRGRISDLTFSLTHGFTKNTVLRVGLVMPSGLVSQQHDNVPECRVVLRKNKEKESLSWPVLSQKQGQHILKDCRLESVSGGGFWAVREQRDIHGEIRVYPDLMAERRALASLFLERGTGVHARRMVGKGREYEKLREYAEGDSYEDIHWKATARRGSPISKVFQVERTQDIYVLVDASRMSGRTAAIVGEKTSGDERRSHDGASPVHGETIFERYISAALVMALAAEKQGDRFGIGVFSDSMMGFVKARSGKAHFNACRDLVYTLSHKRVSPDYSEFFTFTGTRIRKRSLLFILTSLEDPVISESFLENIHVLSRKHLVVVVMLKPATAHSLFDTKVPDVSSVHDIHQHLSGHALWAGLKELERSLYRQGVGFFLTENPSLCPNLVARYLDIKQRQAL